MPGRLGAALAAERERWVLWVPVFLGVGIGVYFSLPTEPPAWAAGAGLAGVGAIGVVARRHPAWLAMVLASACVAAGMAIAQWRTIAVAAPTLAERLGPVAVSGRVIAAGPHPRGVRVTLQDPVVARLATPRTPSRLRLLLAGRQPPIEPGARIRILAIISPPPPPATPGAFDFQPARLPDDRPGFAGGAPRPARPIHAAGRLGRPHRPRPAARKPPRRQLPDVVRRRHRPDRRL
jgi:competence protein ComEC